MENIRITILSAALLTLIGLSGLLYTGNFVYPEAATSNVVLVIVAILFLLFSVYLLSKQEIKTLLRKTFLEKSDEATLKYVREELKKIKNDLEAIKKLNKRNIDKIFKNLKMKLKKLSPYKIYLSNIFAEGEFIENINKIISMKKINSKNLPEFSHTLKRLKEELSTL